MNARTELLALCRVPGVSWYFLARQAQRPGGIDDLLAGRSSEKSADAEQSLSAIAESTDSEARREWVGRLLEGIEPDVRLTTVLDDDYPASLRTVFNLPPFLFFRGRLEPSDAFSVAVVGTRQASIEGVASAQRLSRDLTAAAVVVVSGLAMGIDTAAHEATLDAGGRTIAVIGTGINRTYPAENAGLAERIVASGAVVSQFWPDAPPSTYSFPRRNITMSGMTQGTVVVEASHTSGAKLQARRALEHGRRLFLLDTLVRQRPWAQKYLERPHVVEVRSAGDIIRLLQSAESVQVKSDGRRQLTLTL